MNEIGNELTTNGTAIAANFTDGILTWPENVEINVDSYLLEKI
jgi:hypothetical protein